MTRKGLIKHLVAIKILETPRIIEAFKEIDRKDFVLPEYEDQAYEDHALPIGYEATISQPATVAFMLERLEPRMGERILEIGTGSGYETALLAHLVGEKGKIYSVEYIPELTEFAKNNLAKYNFENIILFTGDGKLGLPDQAPFDKIIASACGHEIPNAWMKQVKIRGRIVAPVGYNLMVLDKISESEFKTQTHPGFVFVPLR